MDPLTIALIGVVAMFVLILMHVPLGVAMALVGGVGFAQIVDWSPALSLMASEPAAAMSNLDIAVIPLFMLMGSLATVGGLGTDIYEVAYALIGHRRGGLGTTTIVASAGFGSVCGSGVATTATFSRVALPEMLKRGYAPSLATGSVAAGGDVGHHRAAIVNDDPLCSSDRTIRAAAIFGGDHSGHHRSCILYHRHSD